MKLFDKRDNFGFDMANKSFYCSNIPKKMFCGRIGAKFVRITRENSRTEDLSRTYNLLLSRRLKQNGQMRKIKFSLI